MCKKSCELYDTDFDRGGFVGVAIAGYGEEEINSDSEVELNITENDQYSNSNTLSQAAHFYDNEILGYQAQSYRGKSSKKEWWYVAASKNCPDTGRRGPSTISLKNLC